jgi:uncharacterized protein (TIGR02145 family)
MKRILSLLALVCFVIGIAIIDSCKKPHTPTTIYDIDGNVYNIVTIGSQLWMGEDLKTTKYNDGTAIPLVTTPLSDWAALSTPAYCWYGNDTATYSDYGALYNWFALDASSNGSKNVCPAGWHVPAEIEWETLITNIGDVSVAGGLLKETGTKHWITPNTGATNKTGFTAIPGGERVYTDGGFAEIGTNSYHWSSTEDEYNSAMGWGQNISNTSGSIINNGYPKTSGVSVRCLKN